MEYISSDTTVWIDFSVIDRTSLPFLLPYTYIMSSDAVHDELLSPPDLGKKLVSLGLMPVEITIEEFELAQSYGAAYRRLSVHDRVALAIAKNRRIVLLTGDKALRKAAASESVSVMGTLGILDQLWQQSRITSLEYKDCLKELLSHNGGAVRLPLSEIQSRLDSIQIIATE